MSFADELRKQTADARQAAINAQAAEAERKLAEDRAKHAAEVARGEAMKAGIRGKCQEAAGLGRTEVKIAKLKKYSFRGTQDVFTDNRNAPVERKDLSVAAAMAWDEIIALGMKPEVRWDHDGVGMEDWFELWATWEE